MSTEQDLKKAEEGPAEDRDERDEADVQASNGAKAEVRESDAPAESPYREAPDGETQAPVQLGYLKFVYGAYMGGAMLVGFLVAKIGHLAWYRLGQYKPEIGEPQDELLYPVAGVIGVLVALYYWKKPDARQYANEVAEELSKVTWPSRKEVTSSTTVVILTTLFATAFFALMDQFWRFVTDKIYTF